MIAWRWTLPALLVASVIFLAYPELDLTVSALYFDGTGFPVQQNRLIETLRTASRLSQNGAALAALGLCGWAAWRRRTILRLTARDWGFNFVLFACGPGVLVNGIMKPLFGRARPFRVTEFGGDLTFSAAWNVSDQCQIGCSFVSGEAAGATALAILLARLLQANRGVPGAIPHRLGLGLVMALPLVVAWQRVAAGRHFLSDVVLGILLVALLADLLAWYFYRRATV